MKIRAFTIVVLFACAQARAYDSGIAIQSDKDVSLIVFVNGKLYNKHPDHLVRVRSTAGSFHLEVKVHDHKTNKLYSIKKNIVVKKGYEIKFRLEFSGSLPVLRETHSYPIYSKYFLRPSLYNKHYIS